MKISELKLLTDVHKQPTWKRMKTLTLEHNSIPNFLWNF